MSIRPIHVGDRVRVRPGIDTFWEYGGEIGVVTKIIPHNEGHYLLLEIYNGNIKLRVFEPPEKLDVLN